MSQHLMEQPQAPQLNLRYFFQAERYNIIMNNFTLTVCVSYAKYYSTSCTVSMMYLADGSGVGVVTMSVVSVLCGLLLHLL